MEYLKPKLLINGVDYTYLIAGKHIPGTPNTEIANVTIPFNYGETIDVEYCAGNTTINLGNGTNNENYNIVSLSDLIKSQIINIHEGFTLRYSFPYSANMWNEATYRQVYTTLAHIVSTDNVYLNKINYKRLSESNDYSNELVWESIKDNLGQQQIYVELSWTPGKDYLTHKIGYGSTVIKAGSLSFHDYIQNRITNVTRVGALTLQNGIIRGFEAANYCTFPEAFSPGTNTWEWQCKINLTTVTGTLYIWGTKDYKGPLISVVSSKLKLYVSTNGTSWNLINGKVGATTLTVNTDYWIKLQYTGAAYILSWSNDGVTWTEEMNVASTAAIAGGSIPNFGYGWTSSPLTNGTWDLKHSHIKIGNNYFWRGQDDFPSDVIGRIYLCNPTYNYEHIANTRFVGIPTVTDGIVTNVSTTAYPTIPKVFNPTGTWEFNTKVKLHVMSHETRFFSTSGTGTYGAVIGINGGYLSLWLCDVSGSWNVASGVQTDLNMLLNTWYYIKLSYDGTTYRLYYTENGKPVNADTLPALEIAGTTTNLLWSTALPMLCMHESATNISMDLKETNIKVNGATWWTGIVEEDLDCKMSCSTTSTFVGTNLMEQRGQVTGFTAKTDHLNIPVKQPTSSFEFVLKTHTPASYASYSPIETHTAYKGFILRLMSGGKPRLWMSGNGSSWNLLSSKDWSVTVPYDTDVWFKTTWDGATYEFSYSTNGTDYTVGCTLASAVAIAWTTGLQGLGGATWESYPFTNGIIYLEDSYLNIDGKRHWSGVTYNKAWNANPTVNMNINGTDVTENAQEKYLTFPV